MDTGGQPPTRLIDGRFELLERLGGGGMGLVWRARDIALEREVALKEVRSGDPALDAADPTAAAELRERVLREARALARLHHPNVAVIHHIVDSAEYPHPWLVMELVTGGSLGDRLDRSPLSATEAARIGRGLLSALRAAHAAGIMHRDVKPGNVLLRPDGTPVLTDFGIAAFDDATGLTRTGSLVGSPEYIAPERIRGREGDPSSDLWSLGMLLYVAVEGRHPLRRSTALATLAAVLDEPLPPPTRAGRLGPLLMALLSRDPALRPDADQADRALAEAEAGVEVGNQTQAWAAPSADRASDGGTRVLSGAPAAPADRVPEGLGGFAPPQPPGMPPLGTPSLGTPPLGSPSPGIPSPGTPPFGTPPSDALPFGTPPLGTTPYGTPPLGTTPPLAPPFGTTPYGTVPFGTAQTGAVARPRRRAPMAAVMGVVVLAAGGTLAWGLLGSGLAAGNGGSPSGLTASHTSSATAPTGTAPTGPADAGPSGADLLTPAGLRHAVAAMRPMIPGDKVFQLVVYSGYVVAQVPTAGGREFDEIEYSGGHVTRLTGGVAVDEKQVDLGVYDWNVVPALLRKAQDTLKVPNATSRYLIVEPDMFDGTPVIAVYLSDANGGSGYLTADTKGVVQRTYPFGS
ncbi:serine/threonine-protein kinase [Streptacidiphilus melanogenes]|uniref:serine/threonine-protein kinase n=1 Tax=Streptacidiphilus melanogenes TaxID=411235 RepID=UPI0006947513|nr:serine/threonine-protein kinase [Streptacidiphilus melanogenes]